MNEFEKISALLPEIFIAIN